MIPMEGWATPRTRAGIFICYRREDARWPARLLADALRGRFGEESVFIDVDRVRIGNWRNQIDHALDVCAVVVVLIGPTWLDELERRSQGKDEVRYEIAEALRRGTLLLPVTLATVTVPDRKDLPDDISRLLDEEVYQLGEDRLWRPTVNILMDDLAAVIEAAVPAAPSDEKIASEKGDATAARRDEPGAPAPEPSAQREQESRHVDWSAGVRQVLQVKHDDQVPDVFGGGSGSRLRGVAFSPDGNRIATASWDGTARVWHVRSGRELTRITHDGWVEGVAFSPDGQQIAAASRDGTAAVWEADGGRELTRIKYHEQVLGVAFSPDGKRIVISGWAVRVWEADGGRELTRIAYDVSNDELVEGVAFSPDGNRIVTASLDGTARVWEADSGRELTRVEHRGPVRNHLRRKEHDRTAVHAVAFSPDGKRIATASEDRTARVWEADGGRELTRITHGDQVEGVAFSPDGQQIVTASWDGTARVWEADSGCELTRITHDDGVGGVAFSPDGRRIATASWDGTARVLEPEGSTNA